jgi:hypothetical protein
MILMQLVELKGAIDLAYNTPPTADGI